MRPASDHTRLLGAVTSLREAVGATRLPLDTGDVAAARDARGQLLHQLDDYVMPRLSALDAPLLCVVGGSTGAGKSTLVNSVVGESVTRSGVLRPTTRASVLIHNTADRGWFTGPRVLPGLSRLTGGEGGDDDASSVRLVATDRLPAGLALLDAPDIDSVVQSNRDLARQLLSAADMWLFVTTAARYADAVPWDLLQQASERGTSVAVVLDRVPPPAMEEVRTHLAQMLAAQGLGAAPVFTVPEIELDEDDRLPEVEIRRLRGWLTALAEDSRARQTVIRRTLDGTLASLSPRTTSLIEAVRRQQSSIGELRTAAHSAYADALADVERGMSDGELLRGEVLARWQELVGTGELLKHLDAGVGRVRDRLTALVRGRTMQTTDLGTALQTGVADLVIAQGTGAAATAARHWRTRAGGEALLADNPGLSRPGPQLNERVERLVREWQTDLLELVRSQAGSKRSTARYLALGVNGIAVLLMILSFSATGGLTGAEVGIAGGSAVVAQRLLEAIFGDQAVRTLAQEARGMLVRRVEALYAEEQGRYDRVLDDLGFDPLGAEALSRAAAEVEAAR